MEKKGKEGKKNGNYISEETWEVRQGERVGEVGEGEEWKTAE